MPAPTDPYDPEAVPVRYAATVLILAERPDLQVLMLKRNARSVFVGDMWVFPGGAVDPEDATPAADALVEKRTDAQASALLGLDEGGIAYWVAALRETFEEAGLLLARRPGEQPLIDLGDPESAARFERHRDGVNDGSLDFIEVVGNEGLVLDGADVHYTGRWITPVGPPRRYDTRFFVTAMPAGQTPLHDDDEAIHHEWIRPADAIRANEADEMIMMTPTVAMLMRLASFATVDEAMAAASCSGPDDQHSEHVRILPGIEGPGRIVFPGDDGYETADQRVESGVLHWPSGLRSG